MRYAARTIDAVHLAPFTERNAPGIPGAHEVVQKRMHLQQARAQSEEPGLIQIGGPPGSFDARLVGRLPEGAAGLLIAGILAASMSSLDSSIHSISTALSHDFLKRFGSLRTESAELGFARTVVVLAGTVATVTALVLASFDVRSLFFFFQSLLGLLSSGVVAIFLLGVFTRRAHQTGALLGAAASTGALAWATFWTDINLYVYPMIGIGTGVSVGYLMSRLIPGLADTADRG